jgi:hypothetical protein
LLDLELAIFLLELALGIFLLGRSGDFIEPFEFWSSCSRKFLVSGGSLAVLGLWDSIGWVLFELLKGVLGWAGWLGFRRLWADYIGEGVAVTGIGPWNLQRYPSLSLPTVSIICRKPFRFDGKLYFPIPNELLFILLSPCFRILSHLINIFSIP